MERGKPFSATDSPLVDFDAVCQKVRAAIEPARAHAISLHDQNGDVLWLSESSMGPDEHNAVREAIDAFAKGGPPVLAYDLGDARSAVLLRAVSARRALVGAIMLIMDTRMIKQDERGAVKMMTPRLQRVLSDFSAMRPDLDPEPAAVEPPVTPAKSSPSRPQAAKGVFAELKAAEIAMSTRAPARAGARSASTPSAAPRTPAATGRPAPPAARSAPPPTRSTAPPGTSRATPERPGARAGSSPRPATPASVAAPPSSAGNEAHESVAPRRAPAPPPSAPPEPVPYGRVPSEIELALADAVPLSTRRASNTPSPRTPPAAQATSAQAAPAPPAASAAAAADAHLLGADERRTPITPEIDRLHAALRRSPIALHVQHLVPLAKGSQLKRYEVLLRSKSEDAPNAAPQAMLRAAIDNGLGSMIDRRVVTELIGWLVHHPDVWQSTPVMFSVNLTTTALHDEHFIKFVELCLAKSSLPTATIAFELEVPTAAKLGPRVGEVAHALHRLGCPMVLDDFALRTECFELLRLPGVRYLKLSPEITAKMRTDKLAQASITAIVQMARVLGMHTVAKRTETTAEQEWLTALGVDFVQSHALAPPALIDSLSRSPNR